MANKIKADRLPSYPFNSDVKELYLILGFDYRYLFDSIFIEGAGNARHNIELENSVLDLMIGITYKPATINFKPTLKIIKRSNEFTSPDKSLESDHVIGQLIFEWYY